MTQQAPSSAEIELIRRLAEEEGWSPNEVAQRTRFASKTIRTIAAKHGITFTLKRSTVAVSAEIEVLVRQARKRGFTPVCAEATIEREDECPQPYRPTTLFRVGPHQRVPVARLKELVSQ